jgi:hypothetical protein
MTGKIKALLNFTSFTPLMAKIIGSVLLLLLSITAGIGPAGVAVIIALASMNLMVAIYIDYFVFGGIAEKHLGLMTYIRTSFKGEKYIKDALVADVILRCILIFLHSVVLPEIGSLILMQSFLTTETLINFASLGAIETIVITLELICERKWIKTYSTIVLVSMTSVILNSALMALTMLFFDILPGIPAGLGVLAILAIFAFVTITLLIKVCLAGYRSGSCDT